MVRNKWLAGVGTKALSPDMVAGLYLGEDAPGDACFQDVRVPHEQNVAKAQMIEGAQKTEELQMGAPIQEHADIGRSDDVIACERTLVCIDTQTLMHPQMLGFSAKEHLEMPFVCLESSSNGARAAFGDPSITGALVYAADDMTGLNVAAALKRDHAQKQVVFVSDAADEWLSRRAACAQIDGIVQSKEFYKSLLVRHIKVPDAQPEKEVKDSDDNFSLEISKEQFDPLTPKETLNVAPKERRTEEHDVSFLPKEDIVPLEVYAMDADSYDSLHADECDETSEADVDEIELEECNAALIASCSAVDDASGFEQTVSPEGKQAFYIPVIGASGGVGKSTVAYMCALCAAKLGSKTLLIDFDLQFGDMGIYSSSEQVVSFDQVVDDPKRIASLEPISDGFCLIAACELPEQLEEAAEEMLRVLQEASCCFDVVVSNGPAFWDDQHMALLEQASKIFFVLDQRMSSAKAAQKAFDLCMRCGMAASPFLFLLNKCGRQSQLSYLDVTCAMKGSICKELPDAGRAVGEYFDSGQAASLLDEKNELACALYDIMADVLPGCSLPKDAGRTGKTPRFLFGWKKHREESACR